MARHLPLPNSDERCGDNGDATSDPVGASLIGESRREGLGRIKAALRGMAGGRRVPRSAPHPGVLGSLTDECRGHGWRYVEGPRE